MHLGQCEQGKLPKRFRKGVQSPVEATLGESLYVAMADEKIKGCLLVSRKELGGDRGNGHDLGGTELGLGIITMFQGFEQFVKEAVERYNLFWHGRLPDRDWL
jgi:hypothetical protein